MKIFKNFLSLLLMALMVNVAFTSCSNNEEVLVDEVASQDLLAITRGVGNKVPKLTVYIETNDVNPLNAKEYYFCNGDTVEEVIDHVILFASNIRGTANSVTLHHNPNQTYILNNVNTLVRPLQAKGIKVLLGLLGDHTGVGFANLPSTSTNDLMEDFAQQVADCVNTYGLDGVDLDDEYARYDLAPSGFPSASGTVMSNLILKLRQKMPNKVITTFNYGYGTNLTTGAKGALSYMHPNFGCSALAPAGLGNAKWAKLSIHIQGIDNTYPSASSIQSCANTYTGYGNLMMFNMREWNTTDIMNNFAPSVWGGRMVCWTGTIHYKNYP